VANTNIKLVGLDFDSLKNNFKEYLKRSDSPFKDVDYEGSNISQLLDVFAYNTYLNSFYLNMVASEMFLDSATLRDSVISHAKELNYIPRSYKSAEAKVSFTVTPSSPLDTLLLPKGTSFTTKIGSNNYTFSTDENAVLISNANGVFTADSISIYEGAYVVDSFVYTSSNESQRFVLSNPTLDTRSITVLVLENEGSVTTAFTRATSFLGQSSNSNIYFLQAAENGQYEILFGDGIIGRKLQNGATIAVEYRVCNGELPNGSNVFFIDGPIQGQSNISTINTIQSARGGGISESIESIKFNAPRSYQNQDRAVTATDYENLLLANFPEIQAVSAFGGEEATPPQYGKVFISVDVAGGDGSSALDKARFLTFIKPRATIGIEPQFIDPEFLYIGTVANVRYNVNLTTLSPSAIETLVRNAISQFNEDNLNNFKRVLRCSKLAEVINNVHPSILGIDLNVHPYKIMVPTLNTDYSTTIEFGFKLSQFVSFATKAEDYIRSKVRAVYTSRFTFQGNSCTIQDDGNGKLAIYRFDDEGNSIYIKDIGSVDYETGQVRIVNLNISAFNVDNLPAGIHVHVNPEQKDIPATKNTIITIPEGPLSVTAEPVKE
jgi:hypothetical protein